MLGRKSGHFSLDRLESLAEKDIALGRCHAEGRIRLISEPMNPWALLEGCNKVFCVSSQLGFEAILAGCEVHCFGMPFYSGWGVTWDRFENRPFRRNTANLEAVFAVAYIDYSFCIDHTTKTFLDIHEAINILSQRRNIYQSTQEQNANN